MKKGFTLIELLAVILILGIIALIAIPTVNNILEEARMGAFKSTIYEINRAVENQCSIEQIKNQELTSSYVITNGKIYPELDIKGDLPDGDIFIDNNCGVTFNLSNNNFDGEKNEPNEEIMVYKTVKEHLDGLANCNKCSEEHPHIINSKQDFDMMRTHIITIDNGDGTTTEYLDGYFQLGRDIIFNTSDFEEGGLFYNNGSKFIPIGLKYMDDYPSIWSSAETVYNNKIKFDGKNHKIKNLQIYTSHGGRDYNSLFARLDETGYIKNLVIDNLNIEAPTSGAFIARAIYAESVVDNIKILNSKLKLTKRMGDMKNSGGIAGHIDSSTISNIYMNNVEVDIGGWYSGFLAASINGNLNNITVDNSKLISYVETGFIAYTLGENAKINNIKITNSEFYPTHVDTARHGVLVNLGNASSVIENINVNLLYKGVSNDLISTNGATISNSNIMIRRTASEGDIQFGPDVVNNNNTLNFSFNN